MKHILASFFFSLLAPTLSAQQSPDLLLINGRIFTADRARPWAEAIAIKDNTIQAVGTTADLSATASRGTKVIDLKGRLVVPGLNDARSELAVTPLDALELGASTGSSIGDVALALTSAADESPSTAWLLGTVAEKVVRDPVASAQAIEKLVPGRKVILCSNNRRACLLSAAALRALRIDAPADPPGGSMDRDAAGHVTGKVFGSAALNVRIALQDQLTDDQAVKELRDFASRELSVGVTSVQMSPPLPISRFEKIVRHADVPLRIRIIRRGREGSDLPRLSSERKLSPVFGTTWPVDEVAGGRFNFSAAEISAIDSEASNNNDQLIFSATGDHTVTMLLGAMKAMTAVDWRSKRVRFDDPEQIPREAFATMKDLGVVVVIRPLRPSAPIKALTESGIPIALTCGAEQHVFRCLMAAAAATSREAAVEAFTAGGASAELAENEKGTLAAGKVADLSVLSQDIFKIDLPDIADTASLLTILDGRIVYDSGVLDVPGRKPVRPVSADDPIS